MTFFTEDGVYSWVYACRSTISPTVVGFEAKENEEEWCLDTNDIL